MEPQAPAPTSSARGRRLAGLIVIGLIVLTACIQQLGTSALRGQSDGEATAEIPPPGPEFDLMARTLGKIALADEGLRSVGVMGIANLEQTARSDADRFRVAVFAAEVEEGPGKEPDTADGGATDGRLALRRRLDELEAKLAEDSPLRAHVAIARAVYLGERELPDDATMKAFAEDHGWVGQLAATHGLPESDPERERVVGGGYAIFGFLMFVVIAGGGALIAGIALLITAAVLGWQGRLPSRVVPPPRDGPGSAVLLETVALFIVGFLALKGLGEVVHQWVGQSAAVWFSLLGQWLLLLVLLWPVVRGLPRASERLGLTRGRGVLREVGAGVVGYVACLPLLAAGAVATVVLLLVYELIRVHVLGWGPPPPPENAIIDIVREQRGSWIMLLLLLLAAVWAPIAEESVFRGALFGHLRGRWHWVPAAVVTALAFGLMHNYPLLMLGGVTALGFGFCLLREWRGSLIAPMTAHAIHNAGVLAMLLVFMRLLGD